jgi:hypothetical protein
MNVDCKTKWKDASHNELPAHNQEVLICVDKVYYIGIYDAPKQIFRVDELLETFFRISERKVYWTEVSQIPKGEI